MKVIVRIFLKLFGFYVFSLFRKAVTVSEFQNQRRDDIPVPTGTGIFFVAKIPF